MHFFFFSRAFSSLDKLLFPIITSSFSSLLVIIAEASSFDTILCTRLITNEVWKISSVYFSLNFLGGIIAWIHLLWTDYSSLKSVRQQNR